MEKINKLCEIINNAKRAVFFGGAGVSTESGIPDFRGQDGIYKMEYDYPPEEILSHDFFENHPEEFWRFYFNKMVYTEAKPNKAHLKIAEMEKAGKLAAVITQNIDGLHQAAGSKTVYELHGSIHRNHCTKCGKFFDLDYIHSCRDKLVALCDRCGGMIKPDVVLYGESLSTETLTESVKSIANADVMIVGGTSLNVYPAAGLLNYFNGDNLVLINKSSTPYDSKANLIINDRIGEVLGQVVIE
ncbi:MAG: NAD-dependent protein deacylase [Eubacteriaceae bacterium]|nr:NAD-dependent protein deacylase [Eubacteriaceae bacterium]